MKHKREKKMEEKLKASGSHPSLVMTPLSPIIPHRFIMTTMILTNNP